jgi:L,D-transpeptidase ErfK/SrfK
MDVARDYSVGYTELKRANPGRRHVDPRGRHARTAADPLRAAARPREGIVINLPEYRLYYFPEPKQGERAQVVTYPISIGKMDWNTPIGRHRIISKAKEPVLVSAGVDPRGPRQARQHPAARRAARAGQPARRLCHAAQPDLVPDSRHQQPGRRRHARDLRVHPHVPGAHRAIFPTVDVGTAVHIISEPIKVGWAADTLYVEVHPPLEEESESQLRMRFTSLLREAAQLRGLEIDWPRADAIFAAATGVPTEVPVRHVTVASQP